MSVKTFGNTLKVFSQAGTPGVYQVTKSWVNGPPQLGHKRVVLFTGTVVSAKKMQKTINVEVSQFYPHPKVKKYVRTTKKFMTHDEHEECSYGDVVEIRLCRPLSARKRFVLHRIIRPKADISWKEDTPTPLTHEQTKIPTEPPPIPAHDAPPEERKAYRQQVQKQMMGRK